MGGLLHLDFFDFTAGAGDSFGHDGLFDSVVGGCVYSGGDNVGDESHVFLQVVGVTGFFHILITIRRAGF